MCENVIVVKDSYFDIWLCCELRYLILVSSIYSGVYFCVYKLRHLNKRGFLIEYKTQHKWWQR